jgi:hypothetical protein
VKSCVVLYIVVVVVVVLPHISEAEASATSIEPFLSGRYSWGPEAKQRIMTS